MIYFLNVDDSFEKNKSLSFVKNHPGNKSVLFFAAIKTENNACAYILSLILSLHTYLIAKNIKKCY